MMIMTNRMSGILLHITSLHSKYGIGDLGVAAYQFIDFLKEANQRLWQILPVNPTGYGDSPYQSFSTFAGNPLLICPQKLVAWSLLLEADLQVEGVKLSHKVDYAAVIKLKEQLNKQAFHNFQQSKNRELNREYDDFVKKNTDWLADYALFMALKFHFINKRQTQTATTEYDSFAQTNKKLLTATQIRDYYYGAIWQSWPPELVSRQPATLKKWRADLAEAIEYHQFLQFIFAKQFSELRAYAKQNDVEIVGDIPIFVALDSADCWANPTLFMLDKVGNPLAVAGVPPDYFSEDGQLWGNPLYNWHKLKEAGYSWWIKRILKTLEFCDILRIDHFRGFESYWSIPYGEKTAKKGSWLPGPGIDFFDVIKKELGDLPIIAEDLGIITNEVKALRDTLNLPGMKVIQFGFDAGVNNENLPNHFKTDQLVVYTGTHDNDTTLGWYQNSTAAVRDQFRRYLNVDGHDAAWDMIRLAFLSVAKIAIVPLQDVLSLSQTHRMNTPGIAAGNWQFQLAPNSLTPEVATRLNYLSKISDRNLVTKPKTPEANE